jgi:protein tyrosine/serine phosphatase
MRRRRNLAVFLFAAFLTLAIVCYWTLQKEHIPFARKFAVVQENVLLRSGIPETDRLQEMQRRYQIKTIVVLLNDDEVKQPEFDAEQNFAKQHGIKFIYLRMGVPAPEQVTKFLEIVNNPTHQPVLVHCWHGTIRTGVLVAIYRIKEQGWPLQKALEEMASYGFDLQTLQYKSMLDIILGYASKTESEVTRSSN